MTITSQYMERRARLRGTARSFVLLSLFAGLAAFAAQDADARGFRGGGGGGFRGGAGINRGGGATGLQRPNGAHRPSASTNKRPGSGQGASQLGQRNPSAASKGQTGRSGNAGAAGNASGNSRATGNGNTGTSANGNTRTAANGNTGIAGSGNGSGNINNGNVGSGNGNTGVVNNGNVAVGNDVDVNVENGGWNGSYDYPVGAAYATGAAVGATTSAAVAGAYYSTLPAGCSPYYYGAYRYYSCAGTWYQVQTQGSSTTYVVVSDPTKSK